MPEETEKVAGELYEAYCKAVGGKAFNGDPLPSWEDFRKDTSKRTQSDGWIIVAETARSAYPADCGHKEANKY